MFQIVWSTIIFYFLFFLFSNNSSLIRGSRCMKIPKTSSSIGTKDAWLKMKSLAQICREELVDEIGFLYKDKTVWAVRWLAPKRTIPDIGRGLGPWGGVTTIKRSNFTRNSHIRTKDFILNHTSLVPIELRSMGKIWFLHRPKTMRVFGWPAQSGQYEY